MGLPPFSPQELARFHEGIKRIRRNQRPPDLMPHPIRQEELDALVAVARDVVLWDNSSEREHLVKLRDMAMVAALACTGLRVSELVSLQRKQLDDTDRSSWVVGKRGKARQYFLCRLCLECHPALLAHSPDFRLDGATGRPLGGTPRLRPP